MEPTLNGIRVLEMSVTGESGRLPARLGVPFGDLAGGLYAVAAILSALIRRGKTGAVR